MRGIRRAAVLIIAALAAAVSAAAPVAIASTAGKAIKAGGVPVATWSARASGWGTARQIPGLAALNFGAAEVSEISCPSPGNCAVGGEYTDGYNFAGAGFVISLRNGRWGQPVASPGGPGPVTQNSDSSVFSVSCGAPGNCSAGGTYADAQGRFQAFVISERGGRWGQPEQVRGTAVPTTDGSASIGSISCRAAGNCSAVGSYSLGNGQHWLIVVSQQGGRWGLARKIVGPVQVASAGAFSCASAGNCLAAGTYEVKFKARFHTFVVSERDGRWGAVQQVPGLTKLSGGRNAGFNSASCPSAGNCTAAGQYLDAQGHSQAFIVSQRGGRWNAAFKVPGTAQLNSGGIAGATSVSCPTAGNCAAGGFYTDAESFHQAFVVSQSKGRWGPAIEIPGTAKLNAHGESAAVETMSCPSPGNCVAVGFFSTGSTNYEAFVVSQQGGRWRTAIDVPGLAKLNAGGFALASTVSCPAVGHCMAGGYYSQFAGGGLLHTQGFVVTRT